jgi:DNA replication protein DnaC
VRLFSEATTRVALQCCSGYSAYGVRAPRLFHERHVARGDGSYTRMLARLAKTDLLVIND